MKLSFYENNDKIALIRLLTTNSISYDDTTNAFFSGSQIIPRMHVREIDLHFDNECLSLIWNDIEMFRWRRHSSELLCFYNEHFKWFVPMQFRGILHKKLSNYGR